MPRVDMFVLEENGGGFRPGRNFFALKYKHIGVGNRLNNGKTDILNAIKPIFLYKRADLSTVKAIIMFYI